MLKTPFWAWMYVVYAIYYSMYAAYIKTRLGNLNL